MIEFNIAQDVLDKLYELREKGKEKIVIMDQFDLITGTQEDYVRNVLDVIKDKTIKGLTFVISLTPSTMKYITKLDKSFSNMTSTLEIPPLSYENAKKLVIERLNEVRKTKSDSLDPFTEEEFKHIYEKSKGNPRLILLLCSSLYDKKVQ